MHVIMLWIICSIYMSCVGTEVKTKEEAIVTKSDVPQIQSMLIFVDTTEEQWGAISCDLIAALEQKTSPIIVSSHLLRCVVTQPTLEQFVTGDGLEYFKPLVPFFKAKQIIVSRYTKEQDTKELLAQLNKLPDWNWKSYWDATSKERARSLLSFNPEEWLIEYVSGFFILIPKTYVPAYTASSCDPKTLTHQQLSLGLKLGCFGTQITADKFEKIIKEEHLTGSSKEFMQFLCKKNDAQCISPIFITRAEYASHGFTVDKIPQWIVYVFGHGSLSSYDVGYDIPAQVAGFDITHFQQLLDFCDTQIITKLFIYVTCYATTRDTAQLFLDKESKEIKKYSFSIMSAAIPDVPTNAQLPTMGTPGHFTLDDINLERRVLHLHTFPRFTEGLALASHKIIPYEKLTQTLIPKNSQLMNLMLIKPAHLEATSLIDANNITVSITKDMVRAQKTKPFAISTLVKKGARAPQALLLYASYIPFEIIIDTHPSPKLISMLPNSSAYLIDKITISTNIDDCIEMISTMLSDTHKIVWVKKINIGSNSPIENLIFMGKKNSYTLFFTQNGEYHTRTIVHGSQQKPDKESKESYLPMFSELLESFKKQENLT